MNVEIHNTMKRRVKAVADVIENTLTIGLDIRQARIINKEPTIIPRNKFPRIGPNISSWIPTTVTESVIILAMFPTKNHLALFFIGKPIIIRDNNKAFHLLPQGTVSAFSFSVSSFIELFVYASASRFADR